jgi:hypothetical protein
MVLELLLHHNLSMAPHSAARRRIGGGSFAARWRRGRGHRHFLAPVARLAGWGSIKRTAGQRADGPEHRGLRCGREEKKREIEKMVEPTFGGENGGPLGMEVGRGIWRGM